MKGFDKIREINLADLEKGGKPKEESIDTTLEETSERPEEKDTGANSSKDKDKNKKTAVQKGPKGKHYRIKAVTTEEVMRDFLFGHYYRQPIMIILLIMGVASLVYVFIGKTDTPMLYVMISVFIFFGYPVSFIFKAKNAVKSNPVYKNTYHYMVDEWGLHLKTGEHTLDVEWKRFIKFRRLKKSAVLYTGKHNGYLFPYTDLGSQKEEILAFCEEKIKNNGR